jgi:hypothetical protein
MKFNTRNFRHAIVIVHYSFALITTLNLCSGRFNTEYDLNSSSGVLISASCHSCPVLERLYHYFRVPHTFSVLGTDEVSA